MSSKKVSAKYSADKKKKFITIELKKEIIEKHGREISACGGLSTQIRLKHVDDVQFFCFKNP